MTIEEQLQRLTGIVDSLAGSVVSHDNQIEALIEAIGAENARVKDRYGAIARLLGTGEQGH